MENGVDHSQDLDLPVANEPFHGGLLPAQDSFGDEVASIELEVGQPRHHLIEDPHVEVEKLARRGTSEEFGEILERVDAPGELGERPLDRLQEQRKRQALLGMKRIHQAEPRGGFRHDLLLQQTRIVLVPASDHLLGMRAGEAESSGDRRGDRGSRIVARAEDSVLRPARPAHDLLDVVEDVEPGRALVVARFIELDFELRFPARAASGELAHVPVGRKHDPHALFLRAHGLFAYGRFLAESISAGVAARFAASADRAPFRSRG